MQDKRSYAALYQEVEFTYPTCVAHVHLSITKSKCRDRFEGPKLGSSSVWWDTSDHAAQGQLQSTSLSLALCSGLSDSFLALAPSLSLDHKGTCTLPSLCSVLLD